MSSNMLESNPSKNINILGSNNFKNINNNLKKNPLSNNIRLKLLKIIEKIKSCIISNNILVNTLGNNLYLIMQNIKIIL